VIYDVIASKRRLLASEQQERFIVMETIRSSVVQYYDLILAQSHIAVAREAVTAAEELLRLTRLRLGAGVGLPADDLRAQANLAARQQDLALALNAFYQSSITLASTLYLEPTVTLVPKPDHMAPVRLVREDLEITEMLTIATERRPDLQGTKYAAAAAAAESKSTLWGGVSPQLQGSYQIGRLSSETPGQSFAFQEQRHGNASVGWLLSPTLVGPSQNGQGQRAGRGARGAASFRAGPSAGRPVGPGQRHQHEAHTDRPTASDGGGRSAAFGAEEPGSGNRPDRRCSSRPRMR